MDSLDNVTILESAQPKTKASKKNKKSRWREIEAFKDNQLLEKELEDLDWSLNLD
ncbi:hypothetical protein CJF42_18225 [Pseudoalteromonas sp. NBT06-2]|uniref:DUF3545 family protein n=1 Tax=Pseudoalteromonas sp. NBT06-2 TaxID=2025950 RepID=UPI000BA50B4E|nr:DUF3545 family protein [Pseudoalteromonas sp. NBT06-2]PAJ72994.1 hypothetical protein CJF42_18225 [Pseudoalteromonas sp. NBT06-2]